jgi:hypothetical protein
MVYKMWNFSRNGDDTKADSVVLVYCIVEQIDHILMTLFVRIAEKFCREPSQLRCVNRAVQYLGQDSGTVLQGIRQLSEKAWFVNIYIRIIFPYA